MEFFKPVKSLSDLVLRFQKYMSDNTSDLKSMTSKKRGSRMRKAWYLLADSYIESLISSFESIQSNKKTVIYKEEEE